MTMTRTEKASQLGTLQEIQAGRQEQAHSPKLRAAMISDHGQPTYTPAAWIQHRMGRLPCGHMPGSMVRERNVTRKIQWNRKITQR